MKNLKVQIVHEYDFQFEATAAETIGRTNLVFGEGFQKSWENISSLKMNEMKGFRKVK